MYSDRLRELFHSRAHAGKVEDATHYGEAGTPGHGPYVQLWLRVDAGVVHSAGYQTYGCPAVIGCCEALAEAMEGKALTDTEDLTAAHVAAWVGGVPHGKEHCPDLVSRAMRELRACHA